MMGILWKRSWTLDRGSHTGKFNPASSIFFNRTGWCGQVGSFVQFQGWSFHIIIHHIANFKCFGPVIYQCHSPFYNEYRTQSAKVLAMPWEQTPQNNSMPYHTSLIWAPSWLPFAVAQRLSRFIPIDSKGKSTWNSHMVVENCGIALICPFSRQG